MLVLERVQQGVWLGAHVLPSQSNHLLLKFLNALPLLDSVLMHLILDTNQFLKVLQLLLRQF